MFPKDIFSFITQAENDFESEEIQVGDNWRWNFRNHVQMLFHLKNGMFFTGENDWMRAFKNIMEPVLSLAYWTEDIEVKDVTFFIESKNGRALSFLIKKYHDEIYTKEHDIDELFDEITESDVDYGGVLVDTSNKECPKVMPLTKVAFCDQTEVMGGPIGFKLYMSPDKLKKMEKNGWGKEANGAQGDIDALLAQAEFTKDAEGTRKGNQQNNTPGKNLEVYIVLGPLPKSYLDDSEDQEVTSQLQIVAAYYDKQKNRQGFILYRKSASEGTLKFFSSQKIPGRALGRGTGEAMIHPQIWTNFLEIHKMQMLEAGAKVPIGTDDETFADRHAIQDMENLEVVTLKQGARFFQVPTVSSANIQLFQNSVDTWFEFAQYAGSAFDPLMGKEQNSGTTFKGQERTVAQGRGPHDRKRGKRAKFIESLYREDILPRIKSEILKGKEFLADLTSDELQWVINQMGEKYASDMKKKAMMDFSKPLPTEAEIQQMTELFKEEFARKGSRHMLKILKDEFRDIEIKMGINIAGKQKDLAGISDKVLSIFQFVFSNPQAFQQAMQINGMQKAFSDILEYSGVSQTDFTSFMAKMPAPTPPANGGSPTPELMAPAVSATT